MIPTRITVIDRNGEHRDAAWVAEVYGDVQVWETGRPAGYRLIELREREGTASVVATVMDYAGAPARGVLVGRAWGEDIAGGKLAADLEPLPAELCEWFTHGVSGHTNAEGAIGFGMGAGDHYDPATNGRGASAVWCQAPSDAVVGLGMIFDNRRHLEPVFMWMESGGPEPPAPCDEVKLRAILAAADEIEHGVEEIRQAVADLYP